MMALVKRATEGRIPDQEVWKGEGLLLSSEFKTTTEDRLWTANDDSLRFAGCVLALKELELLLGLFGFAENGLQLFAGHTAAFVMGECRGNHPPQVSFSALQMGNSSFKFIDALIRRFRHSYIVCPGSSSLRGHRTAS